jgi:hypothetical protein
MRYGRLLAAVSLQVILYALSVHFQAPFLSVPLASSFLLLETRNDFESVASDLSKKGVKAMAPASIVGKSGVKHEFAFAVLPEDGKVKVVVDTELSVKDVDEMKVLKFYVKVFDVSPEKAVLCVSPKLGGRAATLAKEYGIVVLEDDVPKKLVPMAASLIEESIGSS